MPLRLSTYLEWRRPIKVIVLLIIKRAEKNWTILILFRWSQTKSGRHAEAFFSPTVIRPEFLNEINLGFHHWEMMEMNIAMTKACCRMTSVNRAHLSVTGFNDGDDDQSDDDNNKCDQMVECLLALLAAICCASPPRLLQSPAFQLLEYQMWWEEGLI